MFASTQASQNGVTAGSFSGRGPAVPPIITPQAPSSTVRRTSRAASTGSVSATVATQRRRSSPLSLSAR